jgi:hypothetical protein
MIILYPLICALICGLIAHKYKKNIFGWMLLALFLGIFAILILLISIELE